MFLTSFIIYFVFGSACKGRQRGGKGGTIPRAPNHCGGRMTAGDAEKSQQCHKYFLQYSTFASARPQVRT